ncbi:MAG TPA: hypothetical protein VK766_02175 [Cytophagaceae bacterium]|jgi:3-hydroxyacyl-[acyl-carrier-protein] dehydratase|nr:hypothetical protein [Cytophagaceae bacterium]
MLEDTLYSIIEFKTPQNNNLISLIHLNKEHEIFQGHFPGKPIVPGVCLINMITDTISFYKNKKYSLQSAGFIKFINTVDPLLYKYLQLDIQIVNDHENRIEVEAAILSDQIVFVKFKGIFVPLSFL